MRSRSNPSQIISPSSARSLCLNAIGFLLLALISTSAPAQTVTVLANFHGPNGSSPNSVTLVQGPDGNLWGTTGAGGTHGHGTIFRINPSTGKLKSVYSFLYGPLSHPYVGLTLGNDGYLYGASHGYGSTGAIFRLTTSGVVTELVAFGGNSGQDPSPLVQDADGNFYGTTSSGGADNQGTIFRVSPAGKFTKLHDFGGSDGGNPGREPLAIGPDGALYGETSTTIFEITTHGVFKVLYSVGLTNGFEGALVLGVDSNFYGAGILSGGDEEGSVFQMTPSGVLTPLFSDKVIYGEPFTPLTLASDGNIYGASSDEIFEVTFAGTLLFQQNLSRGFAYGGLTQATNGSLYAVSSEGGKDGLGFAFSLDNNLGPIVQSFPSAGKVGQTIGVLGSSLTGTTSVTINGVPASFTVLSKTVLSAVVPAGATTGRIAVTTPSGTLFTNTNFLVVP